MTKQKTLALFDDEPGISPAVDSRTIEQREDIYKRILEALRSANIAGWSCSGRLLDEISPRWRADLLVLEARGHKFDVQSLTTGSLVVLLERKK